jgi:hypothetical protein
MRRASLVGLVGLAVLGGCSGAGGGPRWAGTVTDSAGVQVVHNPAEGVWRPGSEWTVTEALRIGTAEGEPEYQFAQIMASPGVPAVAVASDGRIIVLDTQAQLLKVFSPGGAYERTLGGPGGGPGELAPGASAVLITPGDTVLVSDMGNQRANLYLLDGTFVRSFPLPFAEGIPFRWESTTDGRVIAQLRRLAFPGSSGPPDTMDVLVERRLDGTLGDTLMRVPSGQTLKFSGGAPEIRLFSPEPAWALSGEHVLYGVSDAFRIGVYAHGGALQRVVDKPFTREPVTGADQEMYKDMMRKAAAGQAPPEQINQFIQMVKFAEFYPAFAQIVGGPGGSMWVQQLQTASSLPPEQREDYNPQQDIGSPRWDVFDAEGRFLGVVTMPARFQPVRFAGDKIYGVQRDELDVQYVVVLNLVRPGDDS